MKAGNCLLDPLGCLTSAAGSGASDAATTAWDSVCKSFASAAAELLKAFGQAFAALPTVNLETAGISSTYGISLAIAAVVATLLVFTGVIRTAWTHDGSGIAQAVTGVGKAVLAWMVTAAVATAALEASDQITRLVVDESFGSQQALADRLGTIVNWAEVTGQPGQVLLSGLAAADLRPDRHRAGDRAVVRAAAAERGHRRPGGHLADRRGRAGERGH